MTHPRPRGYRRVAARTGLAIALAVGVLAGAPTSLRAHAHLTRSSPASGAQLASPPPSITLWFSEAPELAFSRITLRGRNSAAIPLGAVQRLTGSQLAIVVPITSALAQGRYTVEWQTAAADGHPSRGRFSFIVLASTVAPTTPATGAGGAVAPAAGASNDSAGAPPGALASGIDAGAPLFVAVRWLAFASLLALVGVCVFRWLILPGAERIAARGPHGESLAKGRGELSRRSVRLAVGAAMILLGTMLLRLCLESAAMYGAARALDPATLRTMLMRTTWGAVWILQLLATVVAMVAFGLELRRSTRKEAVDARAPSVHWLLATVAVIALAFMPALGGHAAASPRLAMVAIFADGLHVIGAGGWLGTLFVMAAVALPYAMRSGAGAPPSATVAGIVHAFSPAALGFASLLLVTGLASAWIHLGSASALWSSTYGRVLLLKVALLVPLFLIGAYNWRRVRPALGTIEAGGRLRRSARAELAVAGLVLAATAVLVAVQPPA